MIYNKLPVTLSSQRVYGPWVSYQFDVKQILVISGVDLPEYYEVDFCNEGDSTTVTMVGTSSGVQIPDAFLATGKYVKAYIVVQGEDEGAVETRYEITLPVNRRPERTDIQPTPAEQQQIDTLVELLQQAASGNSDIFWATFGETTLEQMETAYQAGKQIMVKRLSYIFGLTQHFTNYFSFSVISDADENYSLFVRVKCDSHGWAYENLAVPYADTVVAMLNPKVYYIPGTGEIEETLQPNTIYHFIGDATEIALHFAEPDEGVLPHYTFTVDVGQTAPMLVFEEVAVALPDWYHGMQANHSYEFDGTAREMEGIEGLVYFWKVTEW